MRKINYPTTPNILKNFENKYFNCLKIDSSSIIKINAILNTVTFKSNPLSFEILVKSTFSDLILIDNEIKKKLNASEQTILKNLFYRKKTASKSKFSRYVQNQPDIANFFMSQSDIEISSCYYCGIDYVNVFEEVSLYDNMFDFFRYSNMEELMMIDRIGEGIANKIKKFRDSKTIDTINDFKILTDKNKENYNKINYKKYNHFTLDHILPQSEYAYFNLSLYNLVPSCYSCNTKFKKVKEFTIDTNIEKIVPTSDKFELDKNVSFKLFYNTIIEEVKTKDDYDLKFDYTRNEHIENYLKMFKLNGRYQFHKKEIIDLIRNRIRYPDTKIAFLSSTLGISELQVKKDIFGSELFDNSNDKSLIKLKKDIAKQIGIG